jgi:hypothetical protein
MRKLVEEIKNREEEILNNIDIESIDVYIFLTGEFKKGNILDNHLFQFVFRSFYRLDGAGLSDKQKKCFFELLDQKQDKLLKILSELSDIPDKKGRNAVQFSFSTKLLHTLDNDKPMFDKYVGKSLKIGNITGGNKQEKIESRLRDYKLLQDKTRELLGMAEIKEIISHFRKKFNVDKIQISDIKVLDFILWSYGKLIS